MGKLKIVARSKFNKVIADSHANNRINHHPKLPEKYERLNIGDEIHFIECCGKKHNYIVGIINDVTRREDNLLTSITIKTSYYDEDKKIVGKQVTLKYIQRKGKKNYAFVIDTIAEDKIGKRDKKPLAIHKVIAKAA